LAQFSQTLIQALERKATDHYWLLDIAASGGPTRVSGEREPEKNRRTTNYRPSPAFNI